MSGRYLQMRWEKLGKNPVTKAHELLQFAGCRAVDARRVAQIVKEPASIGRWKSFPQRIRHKVHSRGAKWLSMFGYA